jgi:hypothetical protein
MKLKLAHAISVLVVFFTLSLTAYAGENNPAAKTTLDPGHVDPAVIEMADKILAEHAKAGVTASDNSRVASDSSDRVLSTESKSSSRGSLVSKWLEDRAVHNSRAAESKTETHSVAKRSHAHSQDIEMDMGGGWCDLCGCWLNHGRDPNGTPQSEIGHPYVCHDGANSQNCWSHYYKYCLTS